MKRVFTAFFFAMLSLNVAHAQSAQSATQQTMDPKLMLSSKVNEFDATMSRGRTDAGEKLFQEVMALMTQKIAALHNEVKTASGDQKDALTKKLDKQQGTYSDVKMLSGDIAKNYKAIVVNFKKFLDNY